MSQQKNKPASGGSEGTLPMDIAHIRSLIELMIDNDLSRVELRQGQSHILLRRGQPIVASPLPLAQSAAVLGPPPPAANPAPEAPPAPAPAEAEPEVLIRSPMVGTFYASSDPESPPFVSAGTEVEPNTVVCLIEAMKVFNELKAELSGRVTKVLVKSAQAVEFDQPLFAVAPAP